MRWFCFCLILVALSGCGTHSVTSPQDPHAVVTLPSGLQYQDLVRGTGARAQSGDMATVHYTGWLEDGTKFDSSLDRGVPFSFVLGRSSVIEGWDQGVLNMRVGGTRKLIIPPQLAYGESGALPTIPPNATLTFEVELLAVQRPR